MKTLLRKQKFNLDTTANAMVIDESSKLTVSYNRRYIYYDFKVEGLAKVINEKGLDVTEVVVELAPDQQLQDVVTRTISLTNNKFAIREVADSVAYTEDGYKKTARLLFPRAAAGNLIQYSYTLKSQNANRFPVWYFEGKYPKLHSEFHLAYDKGIDMAVINSYGTTFPAIFEQEALATCKSCFYNVDVSDQLMIFKQSFYARNNIAALVQPDFFDKRSLAEGEHLNMQISAFKNFRINSTVSMYGFKSDDFLYDYEIDDWQAANTYRLYGNPRLGKIAYGNKSDLKLLAGSISAGSVTDSMKARAIFNFVRDSIALIPGMGDIYISQKTEDLLKSRKGTLADKNLLLAGLLYNAGIPVKVVVLSTKGNTPIPVAYPAYCLLNYLIAKIDIDGREYFLDASDASRQFGKLKPECYNGLAIVVDKQLGFIPLSNTKETDKNIFMADVNLREPQGASMKGTLRLGKSSSALLRQHDSREPADTVARNILLSATREMPFTTELRSCHTYNLRNADSLVTIDFDALIPAGNDMLKSLDPFLIKPFTETSHFKIDPSLDRNNVYLFSFSLPAQMSPGKIPQGQRLMLGNNQMTYRSNIVFDQENALLKVNYQLESKPIDYSSFSLEPYKRFTGKIAEEQQQKIEIRNSNQ